MAGQKLGWVPAGKCDYSMLSSHYSFLIQFAFPNFVCYFASFTSVRE